MKFFKIALIISILIVCSNANAQWTRLNGPEGCFPKSLIRLSNDILCGTPQGIYISSDEGMTWQDYTNFPTVNIVAMQNLNDTIIILFSSGFYENYFYTDSVFSTTSFDGGATWTTPYCLSYRPIAELHIYGNTFMANVEDGLCISSDYGLSWTNIQMPPGQIYNGILFFDSVYIFGTSNGAFTQFYNYWGFGGSPIYHRFDSLNTISGETVIDTVFFGFQPNTGSYYDIIRSTNLAQTWQPVRTVNHIPNFQLLTYDGVLYYNDGTGHFYASSDFGNTWNLTTRPHKLDYQSIVSISNGDEICIKSVNGSGIREVLVHYITFVDSSYILHSGIRGSNISEIASNDSVIYALIDGDILKSNDFGITWHSLGLYAISSMLVFGDTIFCGGFANMRSYDGGQTWTTLTNAPTLYFFTLIKSGNRLYASGSDTYYSDDFGDHWTLLPSTIIQSSCGWTSAGGGYLAVLGNDLYNVTYEGIVSKFDNNSSSWLEVFCFTVPSGTYFPHPIIQTINNLLIITYGSELYSSNNGQTWTSLPLNGIPTGMSGGKICPKSLVSTNGEIIGSCGKYGIFHSYNDGIDWQPLTPTTPFFANCFTIQNNQLFAGSAWQGVWAESTILGINNKSESKNNNIVFFPNPASDYLKINLPRNLAVSKIIVSDQLGRKIMEFPFTKNGEEINISQLPEGIYFGQLLNKNEIAGNFKFIVL